VTLRFPGVDDFSRAAKALVDAGTAASFQDATQILAQSCPIIIIGPDAATHAHQAALLTAVETTVRAFGHAPVHLPKSVADLPCTIAGQRGITIGNAVITAGGELVDPDRASSILPRIVIGAAHMNCESTLQVTWDQWLAHVDTNGQRLPERGNMTLAAVAAAALAVTECFKRVQGSPMACFRNRSLNLWQPDSTTNPLLVGLPPGALTGPDLRYLPQRVWMVGLGHLGQAFAWCWRLLPYNTPSECCIQLQDFDVVKNANHSTGMFLHGEDVGRMKTRVIAEELERAGFQTRIVERRLLPETRLGIGDPSLALIGVDKVEPRRLISSVGWTFAVDVGLGSGPTDFTAINLHTFPAATPSEEVTAWKGRAIPHHGKKAYGQDAYQNAAAEGADACGLVQLAEASVAAPFVGVVAACLAVAEALRALHGHQPHVTLTYDAGRTAPARATTGGEIPRIAYLMASPTEQARSEAGNAEPSGSPEP
jgi:hypothetical protein